MTEHYLENYGLSYSHRRPDFTRCCAVVMRGFIPSQCSRKRGHGPYGAYCKQHDPEAIAARREAQQAKFKAEREHNARVWFYRAHGQECYNTLKRIADGHNDPRALAQEVLDRIGQP